MTTAGRRLNCVRCADTVIVHELPKPFIDPALFVCGQCLAPSSGDRQIQLEPAVETRRYDPSIAEVPF